MQLTVFNGSPKLGKSNTELMVNGFLEGFEKTPGNGSRVFKLNHLKSVKEAVSIIQESEYILLAFPLYSYSMPAGVKELIEELEPLCGNCGNKKIGFLVQFGFREAIHARALEKYLEKVTSLLNGEYLGTIIKGGCDGLAKELNSSRTKKVLNGIFDIGKVFGETGKFSRDLLDQYSKPETQTMLSRIMMKSFVKLANKYYWGAELKNNGVFEESYAQPYKQD
ncbi:hypothetical protein [Desulfosporosinus sp. FKB]|uniref:hypothetical protein n=1 Tax=Desulfosporosinus sp. FKB TaxID=1969835 RepID=UPI000B497A7A|nr:hypothetical protein [Desulfosporosinus sp. FKB]